MLWGDQGSSQVSGRPVRWIIPLIAHLDFTSECLRLECLVIIAILYAVCRCSKFPREPKLRDYLSELTAEVVDKQSDCETEGNGDPPDSKDRQIKRGSSTYPVITHT